MKPLSDEKILACWRQNVTPWIAAVRDGEIESRVLVTSQAIIDVVLVCEPKSALDLGCGEGWLARELVKAGIDTLGVDAVPGFVEAALQAGGGRFKAIPFELLSQAAICERFDVVVCNFSLLGNEVVTHLFQHMPSLLNDDGALVVQTIHPVEGCGDKRYEDGWRTGSWAGFSDEFSEPAPWYFRTLETWRSLFIEHGFLLNKIIEPINPKSSRPASIIFVGVLTC